MITMTMYPMSSDDDYAERVRKEALSEIEQERFREAVEASKERLRRRKPLMERLFPWEITIKRKEK